VAVLTQKSKEDLDDAKIFVDRPRTIRDHRHPLRQRGFDPRPHHHHQLGLDFRDHAAPLANVITKFECCNGAKVAIHDLEITFNAPITGFGHNLGNDCKTKGVGTGTVAVTCTNAIPVGDIVVTSETSTGKFALAFWTDVKGACQATATPTPEPASMDLVGIGIWIVVVLMRKRYAHGLP
jgi:hypothetical protein